MQSKEVILTEYDHSQSFSKRKLESNWSKYDEIPDEENNEQLLAANFDEMLLGPKVAGGHFTFAAEKHWDTMDAADSSLTTNSINDKLFKLDLNRLKSGIGSLPFDIRLGYPEDIFNAAEIGDMTHRVACYDRFIKTSGKGHQNVDLISEFAKIDARSSSGMSKAAVKPIVKKELDTGKSIGAVENPPKTVAPCSSSSAKTQVENKPALVGNKGPSTIAATPQSIDNIQGWLDDILNNG